jgi:predicted DsbA family dithiol-disulfide isomerase
MTREMTPTLHIDAYIDVICPWCLIGKRQLDKAVALFAQEVDAPAVRLRWHSVQLLPQVPAEGLDFVAFYEQRLGSPQAVLARQAQVRQAASQAGVEVHFDRIRRFPNSRSAHQLLALATELLDPEAVVALLDDLMCGYFQRGEDIGDMHTLLALAQRHGLDQVTVADWITSGQGIPQPVQVPGVPYFVFNQSIALSGAQPVENLLRTMQAARRVDHLQAA